MTRGPASRAPDSPAPSVEEGVAALLSGEVIGLPTETVYGLAADATNQDAVAKIFTVKGRPTGHPLILHVSDASWLERVCRDVPASAHVLAGSFWPGPLTLVLPRRAGVVSDAVTGGLDTVAVRVPRHAVAQRVLRLLNRPIAAPSANRFGAVSPTCRNHVVRDLGQQVPIVLEGGDSEAGVESTIVDLTRSRPYLLRPGTVTRDMIEQALGCPVIADDGAGPVVPGSLESHYAPRARVLLVDAQGLPELVHARAREGKVGVIALQAPARALPSEVIVCLVGPSLERAAHGLYAALRQLDEQGCDWIITTLPPPEGVGHAVCDRLTRAAAPKSNG